MSDCVASERLFLIDGSGYLYRAFYGLRNFARRDGFPTNAIFGFVKMLRKLVEEHRPERLAMIYDSKGSTFRHQLDPNYKANRKSMPEELRSQIPIIHALVEAYNIASFQQVGFEADDLIGTMAIAAQQAGFEVVIVSGDKDLMQLVSPHISMFDPGKDQWFREAEVEARWGVPADQVIQILGLAGDSSDNIPGVPKIGEKTAAQLIQKFGDIDNLLNNLDAVPQPMRRRNLSEFAEQARLSLRLATINCKVPMEYSMEALHRQEPDWQRLRSLFVEMEFTSLVQEMDRGRWGGQAGGSSSHAATSTKTTTTTTTKTTQADETVATPAANEEQKEPEAELDYQIIQDEAALHSFIQTLAKQRCFSLDTETTSVDPVQAELVGFSFSWADRQAFYLPVGHIAEAVPQGQLSLQSTIAVLKPILEDQAIAKIGQHIKYEYVVLRKYGIRLAGMAQDAMLFSHLLYGGLRRHNLDAIAMDILQRTTTTFKEVAGVGKKQLRFDQVPLQRAAPYACEDAEVTWSVASTMLPQLQELPQVWKLYQTIEQPLMAILAEMELAGVLIDRTVLATMSADFNQQRQTLVEEIHELAGESFNVNSTQQLGEILFVKLALKGGKRTKTGYSTDVKVLTKLAEKGEVLPERVLRYRTLSKLQSTYTDALPKLINASTGRVHTSYNQAVTITGRLSSSDPNLQNIPVRNAAGRAIRAAFIAPPGWRLLSADYSQIELRLLAHLGQVPRLLEAFAQGQDIHAATAMELFGSQDGQVTDEARRMAKTINFGLVYGMSHYGLAKRLGIGNNDARNYMDLYFRRYQGVEDYMGQNVEFARQHGYVETIGGRRCYLREISSSNRTLREIAERTAINAPLQGSAADLIKMAMIRLHQALQQSSLRSRMILQVHDELVLEVPEEEIEQAQIVVQEAMEGAMALSVPLKVDMGIGINWAEAH